MATATEPRPSFFRRASTVLHRRDKTKLAFLLAPPLGWMSIVYLGALLLLFVSAFWRQNPLTSEVERVWGFTNFQTLLERSVYATIALRTAGIAAAVTAADILLAFPLAYFAARVARPRTRTLLMLLVVLPLWTSYLVRVYSWRVILSGSGALNWSLDKLGLGHLDVGYSNWAVWIVFCYLWLPFVVLPIYASLERIPNSLIEASADLGARWGRTLRQVILPIALPGIVAGSIFSFSLTLGDYITPSLVGNTLFIGNIVEQSFGVANNLPFAAAYSLVPVLIVAVYLAVAKRMGAFEAL